MGSAQKQLSRRELERWRGISKRKQGPVFCRFLEESVLLRASTGGLEDVENMLRVILDSDCDAREPRQ